MFGPTPQEVLSVFILAYGVEREFCRFVNNKVSEAFVPLETR